MNVVEASNLLQQPKSATWIVDIPRNLPKRRNVSEYIDHEQTCKSIKTAMTMIFLKEAKSVVLSQRLKSGIRNQSHLHSDASNYFGSIQKDLPVHRLLTLQIKKPMTRKVSIQILSKSYAGSTWFLVACSWVRFLTPSQDGQKHQGRCIPLTSMVLLWSSPGDIPQWYRSCAQPGHTNCGLSNQGPQRRNDRKPQWTSMRVTRARNLWVPQRDGIKHCTRERLVGWWHPFQIHLCKSLYRSELAHFRFVQEQKLLWYDIPSERTSTEECPWRFDGAPCT